MEIMVLNLAKLRVNESFAFFKKVEELTNFLRLDSDQAMVAEYKSALQEFDEVLQQSIKNSQTKSVREADEEADITWRHFRAHVRAMCDYPESAKTKIAEKTYAIFEKFGDFTQNGYSQEYGAMYNLIQELEAIPTGEQEQIMTDLYTTTLRAKYEQFMDTQSLQTDESSQYQKGAIAEKCVVARKAYLAMVKRVNALVLINGESDYRDFVSRMNVIIEKE